MTAALIPEELLRVTWKRIDSIERPADDTTILKTPNPSVGKHRGSPECLLASAEPFIKRVRPIDGQLESNALRG